MWRKPRKKKMPPTNKQTKKGMRIFEHYQCVTIIKRHYSLSYVAESSTLLFNRVLQRILEKMLIIVSKWCSNSVLTVSQAMFDSRQGIATPAVYTEILRHFDAYGFIIRCVTEFVDVFAV